jgi:biotin operon repressor
VVAELTALRDEPHDFQTVVIDSADWLERLIFDEVCREFGVRNIEKADGGYGRGYTHALTHWRKVIALLNELREKRGMMVILVAHAKVERFEDPENAAYDRYTPRLHKHAANLIAEWVDAVLFANKKFRVQKENERAIAAPIGADGGERIIRTVGSPACIAKNRYGLPGEIPRTLKQHLETSVVGVDVGVNVGVQILEYLRLNPGCRANAIANAIGTTTRTVERHIRQLREQGKIEFRGAPKTGGYYLQPEATTE